MSAIPIRVENVAKKYTITHKPNERYTALRDVLTNKAKALFRGLASPFSHSRTEANIEGFWALRDVSFDVKQGEVVGIIGPNGAGKSTLLKILSRITEPTTGTVRLKGRVASLLEVGTGFHPELTGRENIFLNGAILGMTKEEIKRKFDEIVTFAETEKFLDTPVKRYSSGMYVRLAFAVAAHLEPEILLVDEVLAVGDALFQKKCLSKMREVKKEGRTVLFVSHNLSSIRRLCTRVILFSDGQLERQGIPKEVIEAYLLENFVESDLPCVKRFDKTKSPGDDYIKLRSVRLLSSEGKSKSMFRINEPFSIQIEYDVLKPITNFHLLAKVFTIDGLLAFASADWDPGEVEAKDIVKGQYITSLNIPENLLNTGFYVFGLEGIIPSSRYLFRESHLISWQVNSAGGPGGIESLKRKGIFRPVLQWTTEKK